MSTLLIVLCNELFRNIYNFTFSTTGAFLTSQKIYKLHHNDYSAAAIIYVTSYIKTLDLNIIPTYMAY